ncbi:MAG: hypothetical protein IKN71_02970 [Alphaproteobacteria bacterium]|nr:hypothetical protein [Alphaproteobacteria bacterium]
MRYILRPVPELSGCFLLDALYWVAFHKYPETNFDLNIENLQELLDDGDICDPLRADYSFTFFNNDICARYGLPKNPASFDENPNREVYLLEELYEKIYGSETECSEKIRQERKAAKEYNKKLKVFENALEKYLDPFQAKLYLALREGRIKAKGMTLNRAYTYNDSTKELFEAECQEDAQFAEKYKNIKEGDEFWGTDEKWSRWKPADISSDSWMLMNIDWESCQLSYGEQIYAYVQLNMEDLFREFPTSEDTPKAVKPFGDVFVIDDDSIVVAEKRGRKPKMDYDDLYKWYCGNFDEFKNMKQEAVIAAAQQKFPQISRTTIMNKISPIINEYRQKKR